MAGADWLSVLTDAYTALIHFLGSGGRDQQLQLFLALVAFLVPTTTIRSIALRLVIFLALLWLLAILVFSPRHVREMPEKGGVARLVSVV